MKFSRAFVTAITLVSVALVGCGKQEQLNAPKAEQPPPPPATVQKAPEPTPPVATPAVPAPRSVAEQAISQVRTAVVNETAAPVAPPAVPTPAPASPSPLNLAALTRDDMTRGLKEALAKGAQQAIAELGRQDGFLKNLEVKIPMPESLTRIEKTLRTLKQDQLADEFVATMNHAAEKAVPEGAAIFGEAITQMTMEDARSILTGPNDAATQYFRKTSQAKLTEKFLPIVKTATEQAGVTSTYKRFLQQAGPAAQFLNPQGVDLDAYVTQKTLDGLFKMVAAEENKIRQNPVARSTDLLKKVFGSLK